MHTDDLRILLEENKKLLTEIASSFGENMEARGHGALANVAVGVNQLTLDAIDEKLKAQKTSPRGFLSTFIGRLNNEFVDWGEMETTLSEFVDYLNVAKTRFMRSLGGNNQSNLHRDAFIYREQLQALNTAIDLAIQYIDSKSDDASHRKKSQPRLSFLQQLLKAVKDYATALFADLSKLSDDSLKSNEPSTFVSLKQQIDDLSGRYEHDYTKHYGNSFWRNIKCYFRNSDRAAEIGFLQQVSNAVNCTNELRLQAICLVNAKIATRELFGAGSLLRDRLGKIIDGTTVFIKEENERDLKAFCSARGIEMPSKLAHYYDENKQDLISKGREARENPVSAPSAY